MYVNQMGQQQMMMGHMNMHHSPSKMSASRRNNAPQQQPIEIKENERYTGKAASPLTDNPREAQAPPPKGPELSPALTWTCSSSTPSVSAII